jgi:putative oxidoreductase
MEIFDRMTTWRPAFEMPDAISADAGLLILRLVIGALFVGHGLQKLAGWFGGHGIDGTTGFFASLGLRPARAWAIAAGTGEVLGGLGLALGLLTPFAAAAIIAVMLSAVALVHWSKGLWVTAGGYEYNLALIAAAAVVGMMGAGRYSLDAYLAQRYGFGLQTIGLSTMDAFVVGTAIAVLATIAALGSAGRLWAKSARRQRRAASPTTA